MSYYLPEGVSYNPLEPASIIGHEVGEWHVSHDRLLNCMLALDKASDRITLEVIGQTFAARPLLLLTITAPKNHQKIEAIRQQHLLISDPARSSGVDLKGMPALLSWM